MDSLEAMSVSAKWYDDALWTEVGLLLLVIASLVGDALFLLRLIYNEFFFLEFVIGACGVLLIALGSNRFGREHSSYAIASVSIVAASFISSWGLFPWGRDGFVLYAAVGSFSSLLLTYKLQGSIGKILLWTAFIVSIGWNMFLVHAPESILLSLTPIGQAALTLTSSVIFTVTFFLALYRIFRRRIPITILGSERYTGQFS